MLCLLQVLAQDYNVFDGLGEAAHSTVRPVIWGIKQGGPRQGNMEEP